LKTGRSSYGRLAGFKGWRNNFRSFMHGIWGDNYRYGSCLTNYLYRPYGYKYNNYSYNYSYYVRRFRSYYNYLAKQRVSWYKRYSPYLNCLDRCQAKQLSWLGKYTRNYGNYIYGSALRWCGRQNKCQVRRLKGRKISYALRTCAPQRGGYKAMIAIISRWPSWFKKIVYQRPAIRYGVCTYLSYLLPYQYRSRYGICSRSYLFSYSNKY
jgi:hypothetical protein